ncbi:hypothetical protein ACC848_42465, partial [Rhizobium johnstonii]
EATAASESSAGGADGARDAGDAPEGAPGCGQRIPAATTTAAIASAAMTGPRRRVRAVLCTAARDVAGREKRWRIASRAVATAA